MAVDRAGNVVDNRYLRVMYEAHSRVDIDRAMREVETLGKLTSVVPNEVASAPVRIGDLFSEILLGNLLHTSTVLIRRAWVEEIGGFDPVFRATAHGTEAQPTHFDIHCRERRLNRRQRTGAMPHAQHELMFLVMHKQPPLQWPQARLDKEDDRRRAQGRHGEIAGGAAAAVLGAAA